MFLIDLIGLQKTKKPSFIKSKLCIDAKKGRDDLKHVCQISA